MKRSHAGAPRDLILFSKFYAETAAALRFRSLRHRISRRFRSDNENPASVCVQSHVLNRQETSKGESACSKQASNARKRWRLCVCDLCKLNRVTEINSNVEPVGSPPSNSSTINNFPCEPARFSYRAPRASNKSIPPFSRNNTSTLKYTEPTLF